MSTVTISPTTICKKEDFKHTSFNYLVMCIHKLISSPFCSHFGIRLQIFGTWSLREDTYMFVVMLKAWLEMFTVLSIQLCKSRYVTTNKFHETKIFWFDAQVCSLPTAHKKRRKCLKHYYHFFAFSSHSVVRYS